MRRILLILLVAISIVTSTSPLFAACHVVRVRNVQHHQAAAAKVAVPFAVPVAVPVAVASPYVYSYSQFAGDTRQPDAVRISSHAPRSSSLVSMHCATCHSGALPAGELSLQRADGLSLADRLAAIRAVLTRRMPKGAKLDDAQLRGIVEELSSYE